MTIRVLIVFESKYGYTQLVAETIAEGMNEVSGLDLTIKNITDVDVTSLANFDAILVGGPNHYFRQTRAVKKFINKLNKTSLEAKSFAVFDTHLKRLKHDAVKNMEKQFSKIPGMKRLAAGLQIRVNGIKGPVSEGELPKCKEFGKKLADELING